jgi:hypothetical protein
MSAALQSGIKISRLLAGASSILKSYISVSLWLNQNSYAHLPAHSHPDCVYMDHGKGLTSDLVVSDPCTWLFCAVLGGGQHLAGSITPAHAGAHLVGNPTWLRTCRCGFDRCLLQRWNQGPEKNPFQFVPVENSSSLVFAWLYLARSRDGVRHSVCAFFRAHLIGSIRTVHPPASPGVFRDGSS